MNDHTQRIISIMEDKRMTPAQFSSVTGIPTGNLSHILNGRHKPSLAVLQKILNQLTDINPDWLLSGNGTMKKAPERNDGTKIENQTSRNTSPEVNQTSRKTLPEMNQANRNTLPEVNQPSQNSPPENEKTKRLPTPARETDLFKSPQIHKQPAADTRSSGQNPTYRKDTATNDQNLTYRKEVETAEHAQNTEKEIIIYKERPAKTIDKLVIFYSDRTYETLIPEKEV